MQYRDQKPIEADIGIEEVNGLLLLKAIALHRRGNLEIAPQDGGFADSNLPGDDNDALPLLDSVQDRAQRFAMARTQEQILSIGRGAKGFVIKSIEINVHGAPQEEGCSSDLREAPGRRFEWQRVAQ